jgi:hypothetical protein
VGRLLLAERRDLEPDPRQVDECRDATADLRAEPRRPDRCDRDTGDEADRTGASNSVRALTS